MDRRKRTPYPRPVGTPDGFDWPSQADPALYRERKIRLYFCGGCRLLWDSIDPHARRAVEVAERFAEGLATADELAAVRGGIDREELLQKLWEPVQWSETSGEYSRAAARYYGTTTACAAVLSPGGYLVPEREGSRDFEQMRLYKAFSDLHWAFVPGLEFACSETNALWLDVFGNLTGTIRFAPEWITETVRLLAKGMYESGDFSATPILADALQDAGCDNADILDHCRRPGAHVRGCWVVDLILGKE
jgi:hypothetical protein